MNTSKSGKIRSAPHKGGKTSKRGEIEPLSVVKSEHWFGLEARIWYILLGLSVIISVVIYPNILTRLEIYNLGDVADRDIKATNEFLVEDSELTEKNRQDAVKNVLSVYDFDRTAINVAL